MLGAKRGQGVASFNWSPECKYPAWEGSAPSCVTLISEEGRCDLSRAPQLLVPTLRMRPFSLIQFRIICICYCHLRYDAVSVAKSVSGNNEGINGLQTNRKNP
jgi:hypothetical protein